MGRKEPGTTGHLDGAQRLSTVDIALRGPAQPLEAATRRSMERVFGRDLGHVRVHTGAAAADSARSLDARAYTVGLHIVFGRGQYRTNTDAGRGMLAHELTHVVQSRSPLTMPKPGTVRLAASHDAAEHEARAVAQGTLHPDVRDGKRPFARHSAAPYRDWRTHRPVFRRRHVLLDEELQADPHYLDVTHHIEDDYDSDNKARAVVERWKSGDSLYIVPVQRKVLLIKEMLSGFTGDDDENAILDLLRRATDYELTIILSSIGVTDLQDNFHGAERAELDKLLARRPTTGKPKRPGPESAEVISGETALKLQQRFKANAESTNRLNCILIVREQVPQLFAQDPELAARVTARLGQLRGEKPRWCT